MGLPYADIRVERSFRQCRVETRAQVDSEAVFVLIPEHLAVQRGFDLTETSTREVTYIPGALAK